MATRPRAGTWVQAVVAAALPWFLPCSIGQFGPVLDPEGAPQAETQEEFDAYLAIVAAEGDSERIAAAESFAASYPSSALLGQALVHRMEAHRAADNAEAVVRTGDAVLKLLPDNLRALLTLASAIPNAVVDPESQASLLERAEAYAKRALVVMEAKKIPRTIPLNQWNGLRAEMGSEAHEAMGHVAAKRGDVGKAVEEFRRAIALSPSESGRQHYRLGAALARLGKIADSRAALLRAVELGPELIRVRSRDELRWLESASPGRRSR
ncbi:MAG: tetratricopeptide repeat protein [Bryobacterales bacterium]|nr:tetratricopeptide repeat protein [Bryobacterales bacterium]